MAQAVDRFRIKETPERTQFIVENWAKMSDYEMSVQLDMSYQSVGHYRCWLGFYRPKHNTKDSALRAKVGEMFFNGYSLKDIRTQMNIAPSTVSKIIERYFLFKQLSLDTKVIVMDSKA